MKLVKFTLLLTTLLSMIAGCIRSNTPTSPPAPSTAATLRQTPIPETKTDIPTATFAVPMTEEAGELPEYLEMPCWQFPVPASYETPQGWTRYIHAEYCFTFTYPSDWMLTTSRHFIALSKNTASLIIGFRKPVENVHIQRTGVGAGDITTVGTIVFLGKEISKEHLIYEGKIKEILFNDGVEIPVSDLVFTISGGDYADNYDTAALSDETLMTIESIVGSFQRVQPRR
ncbi:MAG: hypothetical protein QY329_11150 [Anaerolineales bacterium]|nr:MAG: hypothetical protein QY329_11150 [Anaerolineales bacterium]